MYDSIMPNVRISAVYSCNNDGEGASELTRLEDISYENCVLLGQSYTIFYGEENVDKVEKTDKPSIGLIGFEEKQTFKNISFSGIKLKKKEQNVRHYFELDNLSGVHFGSMETIE